MKHKVIIAVLIGVSFFAAVRLAEDLFAQTGKGEQTPSGLVNHSAFNHVRDLTKPPLELRGATVSTEAEAGKLAWNQYITRMLTPRGISATEGPRVVAIETVGFDMLGYARKGDAVWEVRVIDSVSGLNAIAWVHSETTAVRFLLLPHPVP